MTRGDLGAIATGVTGIRGGSLLAIQGFGEQAGGGGFADPTRASEEKGVGDTTAGDGIAERAGHMFLAHDGVEGLWTPFASKNEIAHNETRNESRQ